MCGRFRFTANFMGVACAADLHYMFSARTVTVAVATGGSKDAETEG